MGREEQQQVSLTVEQLVAVNPYNPDILNDLEDFVNEQVSSKTYNLEANLCLLRLYQFEPEKMKTLFVANILLKVNFLLNTCKGYESSYVVLNIIIFLCRLSWLCLLQTLVFVCF
uniref:Eukaryotic translation initiation factor 3 subunit K n=1 Tax=Kalanchoe fedtschenkoi TaxID=63787 RepID=A0A7N0RFJ3_KALFE